MKHTFHRLPLFGRRSAFVSLLEGCHIVLPFLLARERCEFRHGRIPVKVGRRFNYHEQLRAAYVYLHFQNAHAAYAVENFAPHVALLMAPTIFGNEIFVVAQRQGTAITLHITSISFYIIPFHALGNLSFEYSLCFRTSRLIGIAVAITGQVVEKLVKVYCVLIAKLAELALVRSLHRSGICLP